MKLRVSSLHVLSAVHGSSATAGLSKHLMSAAVQMCACALALEYAGVPRVHQQDVHGAGHNSFPRVQVCAPAKAPSTILL